MRTNWVDTGVVKRCHRIFYSNTTLNEAWAVSRSVVMVQHPIIFCPHVEYPLTTVSKYYNRIRNSQFDLRKENSWYIMLWMSRKITYIIFILLKSLVLFVISWRCNDCCFVLVLCLLLYLPIRNFFLEVRHLGYMYKVPDILLFLIIRNCAHFPILYLLISIFIMMPKTEYLKLCSESNETEDFSKIFLMKCEEKNKLWTIRFPQ